jgi:hypothetical protein
LDVELEREEEGKFFFPSSSSYVCNNFTYIAIWQEDIDSSLTNIIT